jgi:hypothetical protein
VRDNHKALTRAHRAARQLRLYNTSLDTSSANARKVCLTYLWNQMRPGNQATNQRMSSMGATNLEMSLPIWTKMRIDDDRVVIPSRYS